MMGHDDLGHCRHADGLSAQFGIHTVLGRCLEGRSLHTHIDTMHEAYAPFLSDVVGQLDELWVVDLMHVGESRSCGEVRPMQRMLGEEVDVVGDDHKVANAEIGAHAASRIRHEELLDAQFVHHAFWEGYLLHRPTFVVVEASLHGQYVLIAKFAEDELAGVSFDC